jgi:very-short-patch-repair endonuclease
MREWRSKLNSVEAESVVAILRACIEQPEYAGMTFGIISLLGDEQAFLIQTKIIEQIPVQIIEERRILCGNASHFQGDERDVILLTLVDSNEGDGPLRLTGVGVDASTKQRYNVAASRAKEQLWVVHSLDYVKDLKSGDMRRDLIEYATNPDAFLQVADAVEKRSESPFEEAVGKSLVSAGFNIVQQYAVGAYRLDMVVRYGEKKIALECDGEAWHSSEYQIRSDMERQAILERIGWHFVRVRGSEYYRNPGKTMARIIQDLNDYGILPESDGESRSELLTSNLLEKVKIRVNEMIGEQSDHNIDEITTENTSVISGPMTVNDNAVSELLTAPTISAKPETITTDPQIFSAQRSAQIQSMKPTQPPTQNTPEVTRICRKENTPQLQPVKLFDTSLLSKLDGLNVKYIDNRTTGSFLWVIDSQELHSRIEAVLESSGMQYHFEKRGAVATGNKPAWRVR